MTLKLIDGGANTRLAEAVAGQLGAAPVRRIVDRFPDGESRVELLESVAGAHAVIVQPTFPRPDERLMDLVLLADAARRGGARLVSAVVPYFAYARQDHDGGRAIGAVAVARMIECARFDALITVDLHSKSVESAFTIPVRQISAVPLLADALRATVPSNAVVVAPDLGAVKLADQYARLLGVPVALVRKQRTSPSSVETHGVMGEVAGRTPVIVDDMISTGGTIVAAAEACEAAGAAPEIHVAASHALFAGGAVARLGCLKIRSFVASDSVQPQDDFTGIVRVSLAGLLASEIRAIQPHLQGGNHAP